MALTLGFVYFNSISIRCVHRVNGRPECFTHRPLQMMEDLKVTDKPSEIGYYSGVVVRTDWLSLKLTVSQFWNHLPG